MRKAYQLLGKAMGAAVDAGLMARSPCRRVALPRVENKEMRFLDPGQVARLANATDPRYQGRAIVGERAQAVFGEVQITLAAGPPQAYHPIVGSIRGRLGIGGAMEEIRKTQRLLLRRVAVATGAGLLAVVAGLGMAPAGADDVKAEAEAGVEAEASGGAELEELSFIFHTIV